MLYFIYHQKYSLLYLKLHKIIMSFNVKYVKNPNYNHGHSSYNKYNKGSHYNTSESFPSIPKEVFTILKSYTKVNKPDSVDELLYPHYAENFQVIIKNLKSEKISSMVEFKYIYEANTDSERNGIIRSLCTGPRNRYDSKILLVKEFKDILYDIVKDFIDKPVPYERMDMKTLQQEMKKIESQLLQIQTVISQNVLTK